MFEENSLFLKYRLNEDKKAFETLFTKVHPWLLRLLFQITSDNEVAKDLHQQTWELVLSKAEDFNPDNGSFNNYIYTVARNLALKWRLRNRIEKEKIKILSIIFNHESELFNPEKSIGIKQKSEIIQKEISKLTQSFKDVLILYYFEEKSIAEISEIFSKPEGTIKSILHRGRKKLEKKLALLKK